MRSSLEINNKNILIRIQNAELRTLKNAGKGSARPMSKKGG